MKFAEGGGLNFVEGAWNILKIGNILIYLLGFLSVVICCGCVYVWFGEFVCCMYVCVKWMCLFCSVACLFGSCLCLNVIFRVHNYNTLTGF